MNWNVLFGVWAGRVRFIINCCKWSFCPPHRCVSGVPPVQREAAGLRRLQWEDPGPLHAAGVGPVLARGLSEVRLLRLPPGPGGLHPLHPGQPHPVPQGLPEVTTTPPQGSGGGWAGVSAGTQCRGCSILTVLN